MQESIESRTTIKGDNVPSATDWILLLGGIVSQDSEPFRDVQSWFVDSETGTLEVIYRSNREESYRFSNESVAGGIFFGAEASSILIDPRESAMNGWDGERPQPKF